MRFASGAPAAPRAKRRTRSRSCWPSCSARGTCDRVKIYATDVDEEALAAPARRSTRRGGRGGPDRAREYFDRTTSDYVFRKDLRRSVIFGRNDLVQDPPISRIDLLICRNTLMYFNAETQAPHAHPLPLRAPRRRVPVPGEVGDAAQPRSNCSCRRPEAADVPPHEARDAPQPPAGPHARPGGGPSPGARTRRRMRLSTRRPSRRSSSITAGCSRWPTGRPRSCSGCSHRRRAPVPRSRDVLPPRRAALHRDHAPSERRPRPSFTDVE